jgi:hypothetical protein
MLWATLGADVEFASGIRPGALVRVVRPAVARPGRAFDSGANPPPGLRDLNYLILPDEARLFPRAAIGTRLEDTASPLVDVAISLRWELSTALELVAFFDLLHDPNPRQVDATEGRPPAISGQIFVQARL